MTLAGALLADRASLLFSGSEASSSRWPAASTGPWPASGSSPGAAAAAPTPPKGASAAPPASCAALQAATTCCASGAFGPVTGEGVEAYLLHERGMRLPAGVVRITDADWSPDREAVAALDPDLVVAWGPRRRRPAPWSRPPSR